MDAAAVLGRNPVGKHQFQPEYGDEQADAGRDCRTRLARPNSQARTNVAREIFIFPVQLTTSRIGNLTRLIHTLAYMCDHTCPVHSSSFLFPKYRRRGAILDVMRLHFLTNNTKTNNNTQLE